MTHKIIYEQPLNERIRTFLRLEFLFKQVAHHLSGNSKWDSRSTLTGLLDIMSIFSRTDLKTEVLRELDRHGASLEKWGKDPAIDRTLLDELLGELEELSKKLHQSGGPVAAELKSNEFLSSIQQRIAIAGGTCDFDLPGYHLWLQQPAEKRIKDLGNWLNHFETVAQAIQLILKLIRDSSSSQTETAIAGFYQKTLDPNWPCQLIRISAPVNLPYYAEISGGRHRFTVRFLESSPQGGHINQTANDVEFELGCCTI